MTWRAAQRSIARPATASASQTTVRPRRRADSNGLRPRVRRRSVGDVGGCFYPRRTTPVAPAVALSHPTGEPRLRASRGDGHFEAARAGVLVQLPSELSNCNHATRQEPLPPPQRRSAVTATRHPPPATRHPPPSLVVLSRSRLVSRCLASSPVSLSLSVSVSVLVSRLPSAGPLVEPAHAAPWLAGSAMAPRLDGLFRAPGQPPGRAPVPLHHPSQRTSLIMECCWTAPRAASNSGAAVVASFFFPALFRHFLRPCLVPMPSPRPKPGSSMHAAVCCSWLPAPW